jgi:hypothetical protein
MSNPNLLQPPEIKDVIGPVLFLAGPIQDAPDWQSRAVDIVSEKNPEIIIASPRKDYAPGEFVYERQVDWETNYLRRAASWGAIIFWLANQETLTREEGQQFPRPYAQTTRQELGEWRTKKAHRAKINLVVGIDTNFSNAKYIRRRFEQDAPDVPIVSSLEETYEKALNLIRYGDAWRSGKKD